MKNEKKTEAELIEELGEARRQIAELKDAHARFEQAEERVRRLNMVLRAVRNVNQLITQEKDRDRLLKGACEVLTEDRGYLIAWIAFLDEKQRATAVFESGIGASFEPMVERLKRGDLTHCGKETLRQKGVIIIHNPSTECGDCPLVGQYTGRGGLSAKLEYEGKVFGILSASIPLEFSGDEEELSVFEEVADDIAFALHNFEIEEGRKQAEQALLEGESLLRQVIDTSPYCTYVKDREGRYLLVNQRMADMHETTPEAMVGLTDLFVAEKWLTGDAEIKEYRAAELEVIDKQQMRFIPEEEFTFRDGTKRWFQTTKSPITLKNKQDYLMSVSVDITDYKRLQEQLLQSQKMESVGRLAGGVAHDFNNLLTVILSSCSFMADSLHEEDPLLQDVREIKSAGDRAVALTRQLLAFSRRQILQKEVVDLNLTLKNLDKMLRRLIGEDIDIATEMDPGIWKVEADPGQIEQIVMNLAVNARDAMPGVGKLTIETANVVLDQEYARNHIDVTSGPHVMLAVSDTGCGMDAGTKAQIFEPFFTTKEKGKGTGLGLSMVYGIVKQHGGNIWVYSEPGKGTILKIYLPRSTATEKTASRAPGTVGDTRGTETVLVVEDERAVLKLAVRALKQKGYNVLAARDGLEGQTVANAHEGQIHLLLTDVVMPNMSGKEMAEKLLVTRPDLKVLYMSGYTDNAIVHHGVLDESTHFVQKPFGVDALVQKVREVLDDRLHTG